MVGIVETLKEFVGISATNYQYDFFFILFTLFLIVFVFFYLLGLFSFIFKFISGIK